MLLGETADTAFRLLTLPGLGLLTTFQRASQPGVTVGVLIREWAAKVL